VLATGDLGAVDITLTIIVKRLGGNTADFMFSLNNQGETPWDPPRLVADVFTADFMSSLNNQGETLWDPLSSWSTSSLPTSCFL